MKRSMQTMFVLSLGVVFLLSGFSPIHAQEEKKAVFTLEEVIVTATKREESILEVPLTVTGFSSQTIEKLGIISMDDLNMLAPGLQIGEEGDLKDQGWVIRGIGSRLWGETHSDLAVAFYVDGVYQYAPMGMAPSLFDIERVEIARGPQGTLHGRNSIAGSVSFFNKKPTDEWDMELLSEWTDQFTQRYGIALGGPIFETGLSFRLTGHYYEGDGAQENIGPGPDLDAPDDEYYATALRYKTDRLDFNARYQKTHNKGTPRMMLTLGSLSDEDVDKIWNNEVAEDNYNTWYKWSYDQ
jgi:iron complex outermembrane receptor protein